jgi:hypothetical protein
MEFVRDFLTAICAVEALRRQQQHSTAAAAGIGNCHQGRMEERTNMAARTEGPRARFDRRTRVPFAAVRAAGRSLLSLAGPALQLVLFAFWLAGTR